MQRARLPAGWAPGRRALLLALLLAIALVLPPLGGVYYTRFATLIAIYGMAALSIDLLLGYTGLITFGQAALFGVGAYTAGMLTVAGVTQALIVWPAAMAAAMLFALIVGSLSLRTRGFQFIMVTLAFAQMVYYFSQSLRAWGGDDGFTLPRRDVLGLLPLGNHATFYYVVLALLVLALVLADRIVKSQFGMVIQGIRDNERRAAAIGFTLPLQARRLRDRRRRRRARRGPHGQSYELRQPGRAELAAVGGIVGHGHPRLGQFTGRPGPRRRILPGLPRRALRFHRALDAVLRTVAGGPGPADARRHLGHAGTGGRSAVSRRRWHARRCRSRRRRDQAGGGQVSEALLEISGLRKAFGALVATDDVALTIRRGETHALIGPNGAGKTTLVGQLTGEIRPDAGHIRLAGRDITFLTTAQRARLGLARSFQITSIFTSFSAVGNVALAVQATEPHSFRFWRRAERMARLRRPARALLDAVGLRVDEAEAAARLSHGQHRQLELAMAFATKPQMLLLDEPMAGLGIEESRAMAALLARVKAQYTILLIEHDMDVVFALADRISVLVGGCIIASGTPDEIRNHPDVRTAYLGEDDLEGLDADG